MINEVQVKRNIGWVIRENRIEKGISQSELSRKADITRTFMNLIENGERAPSYKTLEKMASCLDKKPIDLIEEAKMENYDESLKLASLLNKAVRNGNPEKLKKIADFIKSLD